MIQSIYIDINIYILCLDMNMLNLVKLPQQSVRTTVLSLIRTKMHLFSSRRWSQRGPDEWKHAAYWNRFIQTDKHLIPSAPYQVCQTEHKSFQSRWGCIEQKETKVSKWDLDHSWSRGINNRQTKPLLIHLIHISHHSPSLSSAPPRPLLFQRNKRSQIMCRLVPDTNSVILDQRFHKVTESLLTE